MNEDLVFDFGFHVGLDTEFYLSKGFRVVAIEANPALHALGVQKYGAYIESGRLTLLNVGISNTKGKAIFYVNEDNDEWSSFDKALGTRDQTRFMEVEVVTALADEIFSTYGVPYYVKVDIEGFDKFVVEAIQRLPNKPRFLSVEDNGIDTLILLRAIGGKLFNFLDQTEIWKINLPSPPLEGGYVEWQFRSLTSGPFGRELPDPWLDINAAMKFYVDHVRPNGKLPGRSWWDIHVEL